MNPLVKWNYGATPQFPYGDETTYRKAMAFLDGPWVIEDRGCGTAWARKFVERGRYVGVDGSFSLHVNVIADLRTYRSQPGAILMRHLLEHNDDWRLILANALADFTERFALIMFTPFSEETKVIAMNPDPKVPDISFKKQDLLDMIGDRPYKEESLQTATQYGVEHIFYISRKP